MRKNMVVLNISNVSPSQTCMSSVNSRVAFNLNVLDGYLQLKNDLRVVWVGNKSSFDLITSKDRGAQKDEEGAATLIWKCKAMAEREREREQSSW